MRFLDLFPIKFRFLREIHNLSTAQMAEFFNFRSKGSVADLESGKAGPTLTTLEEVVDFFGVSLDWLAGKSYAIYRQDILENVEQSLIYLRSSEDEQFSYFRISSFMLDYPKYANPKFRAETFSLPVRANIVFCLQVLHKSSVIFYAQEHSLTAKIADFAAFRNFFYPLMVEVDGKRKANIRWNLCSTCYDLLQDYIVAADDDKKMRTTPVFDVQAAWNELQKVEPQKGKE